MSPCAPVVPVQEAPTTPVPVTETGSDLAPVPSFGMSLASTVGGSCCEEAVLIPGIFYDGVWAHDGRITYSATVS